MVVKYESRGLDSHGIWLWELCEVKPNVWWTWYLYHPRDIIKATDCYARQNFHFVDIEYLRYQDGRRSTASYIVCDMVDGKMVFITKIRTSDNVTCGRLIEQRSLFGVGLLLGFVSPNDWWHMGQQHFLCFSNCRNVFRMTVRRFPYWKQLLFLILSHDS